MITWNKNGILASTRSWNVLFLACAALVGMSQLRFLVLKDEAWRDTLQIMPTLLPDGPVVATPRNMNTNTSSNLCHSWDRSDQPHASCWYKNLCILSPEGWNKSQGDEALEFLYFSDIDKPIPFTLGVGENRRAGELNIRPKLLPTSQFSDYATKNYYRRIPGNSVLWHEYILWNFGHVLTDNLLPIFSLQDSFGVPTPDISLFEYKPSRSLSVNCEAAVTKRWITNIPGKAGQVLDDCRRFVSTMFPMITRQPVRLLSETMVSNTTDSASGGQQFVCFDNLLVGYPLLSLSHTYRLNTEAQDTQRRNNGSPVVDLGWHGRQSQLWRFRQYTMENLGIPQQKKTNKTRIVIWHRDDKKRQLRNVPQFATYLRNQLHSERDLEVIVTDFVSMSLEEQVELLSQSAVHITGPGGGSFIGVYLPQGSTQIRLYSSDMYLEQPFFNALGYIHADYVGCTDVNATEEAVQQDQAIMCGGSKTSGMDFTYLLSLVRGALSRYQSYAHTTL